MVSLVNPIPTSGEVREMRRRIRRHLPPAIERVVHKPDMLDELPDRQPEPDREHTDSEVPEVMARVIAAASAGLDVLERVSDEAHDTVEENLARVTGLPRAAWPSWPAPRDHTSTEAAL